MPPHRVALLTILACLLAAAPAAASERSEAREYAAAMQRDIVLPPEEAEALVADFEARAAQVSATCLPSVQAAAKDEERLIALALVYVTYAGTAVLDRAATWMREGDARLASIATRSPILRRARAARARRTSSLRKLAAAAPADFCAMVTEWEARGFKGDLPEAGRVFALLLDGATHGTRKMKRASKLLRRHGATRAQLRAFDGSPRWPSLREPAPD